MKFIKFFIVAAVMTLSIQFAKANTLTITAQPELLKIERPSFLPTPPQHRRYRRHHRYYRHHYRHGGRARVNIRLPGPPPPPPRPPRP